MRDKEKERGRVVRRLIERDTWRVGERTGAVRHTYTYVRGVRAISCEASERARYAIERSRRHL